MIFFFQHFKYFSQFSFCLHGLWSKVKVTQSTLCVQLFATHGLYGILQARILEWIAFPFSRGSSQPRDLTQVSCIADGFFTSRATGKPKNTGVGSIVFLQQIFPTQESNRGLLHCRWILYQLSYQGSSGLWWEAHNSHPCSSRGTALFSSVFSQDFIFQVPTVLIKYIQV